MFNKNHSLEGAIKAMIGNLRKKDFLDGVKISKSHEDSGIVVADVTYEELNDYISDLDRIVHFEIPANLRDLYQKTHNVPKIIFNAAMIELAKYLPYIGQESDRVKLDKNFLYRMIGVDVGENVTVAPRVQLDYMNPELITIGDDSVIGDGAKLWVHNYSGDSHRIGPITIGKNSLIGAETTIFTGTEIGDNVQIGYGSLLSNSVVSDNSRIAPYSVVRGNK